jgi:hypothetical protein
MKTIILFFLFIAIGVSFNSFSQDSKTRVESISFAQGFAGMRSLVLINTENHIQFGEYEKTLLLLESSSVADNLVGAIICGRLSEDKKLALTDDQIEKINLIKESEEELSFNFGCTCQYVISLKDYFTGQNPCNFRDSMNDWILGLIQKYQ